MEYTKASSAEREQRVTRIEASAAVGGEGSAALSSAALCFFAGGMASHVDSPCSTRTVGVCAPRAHVGRVGTWRACEPMVPDESTTSLLRSASRACVRGCTRARALACVCLWLVTSPRL